MVIPTFNDAKYLCLAVESLLEQTCAPYEIIIIDDCPTDQKTEKMLRSKFTSELKAKRIRYYKNKKNLGASGSRNRGSTLAHGDLMIFCDSDDMYKPQHLENFLKLRAQTNADIVMCHTKRYIDSDGKLIRERRKAWRGNTEYKLFILGMTGSCMMMAPEVFSSLGGFDEKVTASHDKQMFAEDWDILVRAFHKGYKIAMDDSGTYLHREHGKSLTGNYFDWTKHRCEVIFPRISADPKFTRKQLAIFTYGTLVSAPIKQTPTLLMQLLRLSPFFFIIEPVWPQLAARSLSNRMQRNLKNRRKNN